MANSILPNHTMAAASKLHIDISITPNLSASLERLPLPPPGVNKLVQDVIRDQVIAQPEAQAIASATVNLTYKELDESSTRLAVQIASSGIDSGSIVPIIHKKVRYCSISATNLSFSIRSDIQIATPQEE